MITIEGLPTRYTTHKGNPKETACQMTTTYEAAEPQQTWISNFHVDTASSLNILWKELAKLSRKNRWQCELFTSRPGEMDEAQSWITPAQCTTSQLKLFLVLHNTDNFQKGRVSLCSSQTPNELEVLVKISKARTYLFDTYQWHNEWESRVERQVAQARPICSCLPSPLALPILSQETRVPARRWRLPDHSAGQCPFLEKLVAGPLFPWKLSWWPSLSDKHTSAISKFSESTRHLAWLLSSQPKHFAKAIRRISASASTTRWTENSTEHTPLKRGPKLPPKPPYDLLKYKESSTSLWCRPTSINLSHKRKCLPVGEVS